MRDLIIPIETLTKTEEITINKRKKAQRNNFMALENSSATHQAYLETLEFTYQEQRAMKLLLKNFDQQTNTTTVSTAKMSNVERNDFSKGYKSLNKKSIVIRTKRGRPSSYMISPYFIQSFGRSNEYEQSILKWTKYIK